MNYKLKRLISTVFVATLLMLAMTDASATSTEDINTREGENNQAANESTRSRLLELIAKKQEQKERRLEESLDDPNVE